MSNPVLSAKQRDALINALVDAFDEDSFKLMLVRKVGCQPRVLAQNLESLVTSVVLEAERDRWLDKLIKGARAANPRHPQLNDLERELAVIPTQPGVLQRETLDEFVAIINDAGVGDDDLLECYRKSAPTARIDEFDNFVAADLVVAVVYFLSNFGRDPLLEFAVHLRRVARAAEKKLIVWNRDAYDVLGLDAAARMQIESAPKRLSESYKRKHLYLVFVVQKVSDNGDLDRPGFYQWKAWRVLEKPNAARWEHAEPTPALGSGDCDQEHLREAMAKCIDLLGGDLKQTKGEMTIELFLPLPLFGCGPDQWELAGGLLLGIRFPMVIRSSDRFSNTSYQRDWWNRWQRHKKAPKPLIVDKHPGKRQLVNLVFAQDVTALAFTFPPDATELQPDGLLEQLLLSGVGVAVWPRCETPKLAELSLTLSKRKSDWRRDVFEARRKYPEQQLTLLWDDADRLPPDFPLMQEDF